jgi:peptidoglycan/LPS O-acetylase OafA/YrhL
MKTQTTSYAFITPLNALRFFAAVGVVVFHYGRWSFPFTLPILKTYVMNANTGVTLFFVLSGFIMVHVYGKALSVLKKHAVVKFYRARIARIVPLYIGALLLTVIPFYMLHKPVSTESFILHLFFLQAWVPNQSLTLNFTAWSLSVEMMFYALFPLLYVWSLHLSQRARFLIVSVVWLVSNAITVAYMIALHPDLEQVKVIIKFFPLLHLNSFLLGMIAGIWYATSKAKIRSVLVYASILFLLVAPFLVSENMQAIFHNGLFAPAFAVLIVAVAQSKNFFAKALSARPLILGGDMSYGIYLLQVPVYNAVYYIYKQLGIFHALGEEGRFFLYVPLLLVVSWISLVTLERYGKRWIRGTGE